MTKEEYQQWVKNMWYSKPSSLGEYGLHDLYIMTAGLGGETGEVLEVLKKKERDGVFDPNDLLLELGDVLYNLTMIATAHGFSLEEVIYANKKKLEERRQKKELVA